MRIPIALIDYWSLESLPFSNWYFIVLNIFVVFLNCKWKLRTAMWVMCSKVQHLLFYTGVTAFLFITSYNPNSRITGYQSYLHNLSQKRAHFCTRVFPRHHWHLLRLFTSTIAPSISLCAAVAGMAIMVISLLKRTTQQGKCYAGVHVNNFVSKPSGIIDGNLENVIA